MKIQDFISKNIPSGDETFIVLGSTSGIGLETVKTLSSLNYHIVMGARDLKKAKVIKEGIISKNNKCKIDIELYDQASFQSIDNFVEVIKNKYPNFKGLVFNAGVFHTKKGLKTKEDFPLVLGTNFYGPLYFMYKINDFLINKKEETRIIFVSSLASRCIKYKPNILNMYIDNDKEYFVSKLGITNLFYWLTNNNKNKNIKYLYMEPGVSCTDIIRGFPAFIQKLAKFVMPIFSNSPLKSSLGISYLITSPNVKNGDSLAPKHFFHFKGYPNKIKIKKKTINPLILKDAYKEIGIN